MPTSACAQCGSPSVLLIPRIKNHLSSFELGFLNIFLRQNLLRSLSLVFFLLQRYKYGAKKCPKNHVRFDFWDDSTLANQKTGKTIENPLKELQRNQQCNNTGCYMYNKNPQLGNWPIRNYRLIFFFLENYLQKRNSSGWLFMISYRYKVFQLC